MKNFKFADRMNNIGTEKAFEVLAKCRKLEAKGADIIHLQIGEPDFATPQNIVEAGRQALKDGYTHYTPNAGMMDVREAIAEYAKKLKYRHQCGGSHYRSRWETHHVLYLYGAGQSGRRSNLS